MSVSIKIENESGEYLEMSSVDSQDDVEVTLSSKNDDSVNLFLPADLFEALVEHIERRILKKEKS